MKEKKLLISKGDIRTWTVAVESHQQYTVAYCVSEQRRRLVLTEGGGGGGLRIKGMIAAFHWS